MFFLFFVDQSKKSSPAPCDEFVKHGQMVVFFICNICVETKRLVDALKNLFALYSYLKL